MQHLLLIRNCSETAVTVLCMMFYVILKQLNEKLLICNVDSLDLLKMLVGNTAF